MGVLAHFRGGPLDGQTHELEEAPSTYRVPRQPIISYNDPRDTPTEMPSPYVYTRASGVVANEVVYEWEAS